MQEVRQRVAPFTNYSTKDFSSSVSAVECYVCGKGLQDGHSITAKTLPSGIVLFCNIHCPG
ncbi:MAG: hypothetical protein GTN97_04475 [Nitrosopumilaceae archaeon]|nr:hypothetical protein [Nitrosopumilaceae archaeon]NIP10295.1 hypothetical protein [Nitrosopumilaceae archaeon]NIS95158.1 hypothetical protein [Nitrosopumilaceae archaeon]